MFCLIEHYKKNAYEEEEVQLHVFCNVALDTRVCLATLFVRFSDGRCWLLERHRPGVDVVKKINVYVFATTRTLVLQLVARHHTAGHAI